MNSVNLVGRLTNDPEIKFTPQGISVCNFCLAVNETKEVAYFIDCVAWRNVAENISKFFKKGSMIGLSGSLTTRTSEYNGIKRKFTEVKVNAFDFVEPKGNYSNDAFQDNSPKFEELAVDDQLPF